MLNRTHGTAAVAVGDLRLRFNRMPIPALDIFLFNNWKKTNALQIGQIYKLVVEILGAKFSPL